MKWAFLRARDVAAPDPAPRAPERQSLRAWLSSNWPDVVIVGALLALFCFVHRRLEAVEIGGDAISKWQFVRQWSYSNDLAHGRWDQHKARMGVNAVTWLVQLLFGHSWRAYYVGPFFMAAAQLPFVYLLGKRLSGRAVGVLAAFFVIYLAAVHRSASQLLPDGYVGTYAIIATYLFARFVDAEERRALGFLVATSVVGFVGYLAKETFCFFYPAFIVAIWLGRRRVQDVLLTCGIWLAGLGLETLAYRLFTNYSGRLAIIRGTHMAGAADEETPTIGLEGLRGLFGRLDLDWDCLLGVGLLGAVWLLFFNRKATTQGRAIALLGISHVAALSVSSQIWQSPRPRYMDPATPFAALCAAVVFGVLLGPLLKQLERWPLFAKYGPTARPSLAAAWLVATACVAALLTYRHQLQDPPFDGVAQGASMAQLTNAAYDRNLPIACDPRGAKVLMTAYDVYLLDRRLARSGILPDYERARRHSRRFTYVVKDPDAYDERVFSRMLAAGCVVQLRRSAEGGRRGYVDARSHADPPSSCDSELADAVSHRR